MADPRLPDETPVEPARSAEREPDAAPLPPPVREHLGRELRTTYHAEVEKPAFLGDPGVPPQFEPYIQKIEAQERVHEQGVEAVRMALQDMQIDAALREALDLDKR